MWSIRFALVVVVILVTMTSLLDAKKLYISSKDYEDLMKSGMWSLAQKMEIFSPRSIFEFLELEEQNANNTCFRDLRLLQDALNNQTFWALKMLDSSSKIPSGLLEDNVIDLGQYDECVNVRGTWKDIEIQGRSCMYASSFKEMSAAAAVFKPMLTMCVPATCEPEDLMVMFSQRIQTINEHIKQLNKTIGTIPFGLDVKVTSVSCSHMDDKVWDTWPIVCLTIFLIYVCFLLACTYCDVTLQNLITAGDEKTANQDHSILAVLSKFSLLKNAAAILNTSANRDSLPGIHGIRFLSMAWIVLYHQHAAASLAVNINNLRLTYLGESWSSLYILNGLFAVDTFFAISGFLMAYLFLKQMPKQKRFNIPVYYLHRYFRLTPTVLVLIIFSIVFLPKINTGARWDFASSLIANKCRRNWWSVILYVQNFVHPEAVCLDHLWYLAVDMQLFWISPIILYPLYRMPKLGLSILALFIAASIAVPAAIIGYNQYTTASSMRSLNSGAIMYGFEKTYIMPYCRAAPWLLGIYLGYEVATKNRKVNQRVMYAGWALCIATLAFCFFGVRYFMEPDYEYHAVLETFYSAISKPFWGFGVCWVIFACINDRNGPVTKLLNWKYFLPLSKLSYCGYLVHFVLQVTEAGSTKVPIYFSDYNIWKSFLADLTLSLIIAFFFSLLIESPLLVLEAMVLRRRRKSHSKSSMDLSRSDVEGRTQEVYHACKESIILKNFESKESQS